MWERYKGRVRGVLLTAILACCVFAFGLDGSFKSAPLQPDQRTGQVMPHAVRGRGTVYLSAEEDKPLEPLTMALAISVVLLVATLVPDAIAGFRKGWSE